MNTFIARRFGSTGFCSLSTLEEAQAVEGTNLIFEVNPDDKTISAWVKMNVGWEEALVVFHDSHHHEYTARVGNHLVETRA